MTASLTTLITKIQILLLDDGTRYSTATCTAAVRQALKEFNEVAPISSAELVTVIADQRIYELTGADFANMIEVTGVWLNDSDGEDDEELEYTAYFEDNRAYIKIKETQTAGESLLVRFTTANTINGLDSAVISTVPDVFDQTLVDGGTYYSICIRSVGRVETINLNRDVPDNLRETAAAYFVSFRQGKRRAGRRSGPSAKVDQTWAYSPAGF